MIVIGITGLIGSGKNAVADYIKEKYNFVVINMGDVFRDILKREGKKITRDSLQDLRKTYGNNFLAQEVVRIIKENHYERAIIAGIRRSEDAEIPKKEFPGMKLVVIYADSNTRFQRLKKRNRENDAKTREEFDRQMKREYKFYDFDRTFSMADFVIDNNGSFDKLHNEIDKVMKKIVS